MKVGTRVELMPHLDLWMQGARFGEVVGTISRGIVVKLDHPQVKRPKVFLKKDLKEVK